MRHFDPIIVPAAGFALVLLLAAGPLPAGDPASIDQDWWGRAQERIAAAEYEVAWDDDPPLPDLDGAWQAPNREQGFRTWFTQAGIRLVPREEPAPSWEWSLTLVGVGRRGSPAKPVEPATPLPSGGRVDYDRGAIVEWYVNDARGLEQGFTLRHPPAEGEAGEVVLEMRLGGTLTPRVARDGQAIDFVGEGSMSVLRYGSLLVVDARDERLPARMEGFSREDGSGIRIVFHDTGAVYPVLVDPLATSPAWTGQSNQTGAHYGYVATTAGDVNGDGYSDVLVTAPLYDAGSTDEGRVWLYHGSPSGPSGVPAWQGDANQAGARYGHVAAPAGDVNGDGFGDVIVTAPLWDGGGHTDEGRIWVYHGSASGLATIPAFAPESDQGGAHFGWSAASAGDVDGDGYADVIVGAPLFDLDASAGDEGLAYVWFGSAGGLGGVPWQTTVDQDGAEIGASVGSAGDVNGDGFADVVVGAPGFDAAASDEGAALVWHGGAGGLGDPASADWPARSGQQAARGGTVASAGDVNGDGYADLLLGAPLHDQGETDEGLVLIFHGSSTGLDLSGTRPLGLPSNADWAADADVVNARLGQAVATAGDVNADGYADVIAGAPGYTDGQSGEGAAFVWFGSASGTGATPAWSGQSHQASAEYGFAAGPAGDVNGDGHSDVVVGARLFDEGSANEGKAFLYLGSSATLAAAPSWQRQSDQPASLFGSTVGSAGDVNGDGFEDLVVGSPAHDGDTAFSGAVFVFHGSASGPADDPDWTLLGEGNEGMGSPAAAGDVNGDGYADVLARSGSRVVLFHGSARGLSSAPDWEHPILTARVAGAGDVNGDGYADVLLGVGTSPGGVRAVYGSGIGLGATPDWEILPGPGNVGFGRAVAAAGDVNGDGYSDVIVGDPYYQGIANQAGGAWVYLGTPAGLETSASWSVTPGQPGGRYGWSVASAGDVNGDGYSDVLVGAPQYESGGLNNEGYAWLYLGSAAGTNLAPSWSVHSGQFGAGLGETVAGAGDVDGDGYSDVLIAAPFWDIGGPEFDQGRVWLHRGSAAGLGVGSSWTRAGDDQDQWYGRGLGTADVNGDGCSDVLIGAPYNGHGNAERVDLFYGNATGGVAVRPRQLRVDSDTDVVALGASDREDAFRASLVGRSPYGAGRVRVEVEVKPLGTPFDGVGTIVGSWHDQAPGGTPITELASGLAGSTRHHWRARLRYDPASVPFQQYGRWFSPGTNGWQEADLTTNGPPAGQVADDDLRVAWDGTQVTLIWGLSCNLADSDYVVYEGTLSEPGSHVPRACSTSGFTTSSFEPQAADSYYLVAPRNAMREGSVGFDSTGVERDAAASCLTRSFESCE